MKVSIVAGVIVLLLGVFFIVYPEQLIPFQFPITYKMYVNCYVKFEDGQPVSGATVKFIGVFTYEKRTDSKGFAYGTIDAESLNAEGNVEGSVRVIYDGYDKKKRVEGPPQSVQTMYFTVSGIVPTPTPTPTPTPSPTPTPTPTPTVSPTPSPTPTSILPPLPGELESFLTWQRILGIVLAIAGGASLSYGLKKEE